LNAGSTCEQLPSSQVWLQSHAVCRYAASGCPGAGSRSASHSEGIGSCRAKGHRHVDGLRFHVDPGLVWTGSVCGTENRSMDAVFRAALHACWKRCVSCLDPELEGISLGLTSTRIFEDILSHSPANRMRVGVCRCRLGVAWKWAAFFWVYCLPGVLRSRLLDLERKE
jgi:hypothetical protein